MATNKYNYVILVLVLFIMIIGGCKLQKEASSQEYPSKPITAIVPFAAGGAADMMVRNMEHKNKGTGTVFCLANMVPVPLFLLKGIRKGAEISIHSFKV